MATVAAVITDRLSSFSIEITPVRLETALIDADLNGSTDYDKSNGQPVKQVIVGILADLLAMPDVTEGGFSQKWDRNAVRAYCSQLRTELGEVDSSVASVSDRSYLW